MIFNTLSFIFFSKESFLISEMLEFKVKVFYLHVCEIISSFHISLFSKLWRLSKLHFKGIMFSHTWIVDGNLLHSGLNRAWHFWLSTRFYRKYPKMFKTGFYICHPRLQRSGNVRKPLLNLDSIFRWICIDILCRCILNLNSAIYFQDIVIFSIFSTILILSNFLLDLIRWSCCINFLN